MIQIKNRFTDAVIFEFDTDSMKICIEAAVKSGADLSGADLSGADLSRANLSGADLSVANLSGANLSRANLSRAKLSRAKLSGADLSGADLSGADLSRASYGKDIPFTKPPKQLLGMYYEMLFLDAHIKIGCKLFSTVEWKSFSDEEISEMDSFALKFWNENKNVIFAIADIHQKA